MHARHPHSLLLALGALALLAASPGLAGQQTDGLEAASHLVMPQTRAFTLDPARAGIQIAAVEARVAIRERAAATHLQISLVNPGPRQAEAVLLLPVPESAAISAFRFEGAAAEPGARVLPEEEARRIYDSIVARLKDPALLEFAGYNLVRSSVFPVPAGGTQRIRLTYETVLGGEGQRVDYVLPRSQSLAAGAPWSVSVQIESSTPISTVYSPSHELRSRRLGSGRVVLQLADGAPIQPGAFRLSYLLEGEGLSASLVAYPDPAVGGGYFLLLAGLPVRLADGPEPVRREVTLVLDRSGSMAGEKLDQARAAALQVIEGLADGEAFNLIDYSTSVAKFAADPVLKSPDSARAARRYLEGLRPGGGTNIHDALLESLRQTPRRGMLPIVLFLTDGLPTVGRTGELQIRKLAEGHNPHERRIFCFGVGSDVNVPLLDRLSECTRATSTYVQPREDVEVAVAEVFRRTYGPVFSDLRLTMLGASGRPDVQRVRELMPDPLPDLFDGDQLVLLGQYRDGQALNFRIEGSFFGQRREFSFGFDLRHASTANSFVPRLWASRRIAYLVDQIRQAGATLTGAPLPPDFNPFRDPRLRELTDEVLRLSTEFGILSEYTAFLAEEGTDLSQWENLRLLCSAELNIKAVRTRSGLGAVNQGLNLTHQKAQARLNLSNTYLDESLQPVQFSGVQQIHDRAFFRRGERWVDARLVGGGKSQRVEEVVDYGSARHRELLQRLVGEGRQGVLSLPGEILIPVDGHNVLVNNKTQD